MTHSVALWWLHNVGSAELGRTAQCWMRIKLLHWNIIDVTDKNDTCVKELVQSFPSQTEGRENSRPSDTILKKRNCDYDSKYAPQDAEPKTPWKMLISNTRYPHVCVLVPERKSHGPTMTFYTLSFRKVSHPCLSKYSMLPADLGKRGLYLMWLLSAVAYSKGPSQDHPDDPRLFFYLPPLPFLPLLSLSDFIFGIEASMRLHIRDFSRDCLSFICI